ncbi:hypothetical protein PoB_000666400 [Plakobranchus ocellatus]|uniref:Uncharacterized protein n=1 Tax=Plakobranchus ocellatus TaxID=259542 RepID=A0AAV3YAW4_9GAST|nr:hypothetical protein PoB_000666400 [Plakobranchus ocellatus]
MLNSSGTIQLLGSYRVVPTHGINRIPSTPGALIKTRLSFHKGAEAIAYRPVYFIAYSGRLARQSQCSNCRSISLPVYLRSARISYSASGGGLIKRKLVKVVDLYLHGYLDSKVNEFTTLRKT